MVHVRGQAADFDDWQARGNPGWGWNDVLPYFQQVRGLRRGADAWRGIGGPLHVRDVSRDAIRCASHICAPATEIGLPRTPDFNGADQEGVGLYQITTRNGRRMSAARAYLWPARDAAEPARRDPVRMRRASCSTGRRAVGVEYRAGRRVRDGARARAK